MFYAIEKYKLPAQILLGLIALTFIGFGASTLAQPGHDYVARIGDIKISEQDINDAMHRVPPGGAAPSRAVVYQQLLQQAYMQQGGHDLGVDASLEQIKRVIAADPEFQENGKFSEQKYQELLRQNQLTEAELIKDMRKRFAIQSVFNLLQGGIMVSDVQAKQMVHNLQAARQIRAAPFAPKDYADEVVINDAALQTYYQTHKAKYEQAQAVKFEFVVLSAQELGAKVNVSDEELRQMYAQMPADASGARPDFEHIKAQLLAEAKLRKGQQELAQAREKLATLVIDHPQELKAVADRMGLKINNEDKWLTADEAKAQGMPTELQTALFSDDVLMKKYNSEPVAVGNDSVWVVRAKEVRAKHLANLDEVKAEVRADYVQAESLKLALAAAKAAQAQAVKGVLSGIDWSEVESITADQARVGMAPADLQQFLKAHPQDGKPAYVLLGSGGAPLLLEVRSIKPPADIEPFLPQMKQMLAQNHGAAVVAAYLKSLQQRYPLKQGAQRADNSGE